MAEELQSLLERIQQEGVKKADDQKDAILADAKAEAEKIVAAAKSEADSLRKSAEEEAEKTQARAKAAIQQAARDIMLGLKEDLQTRLQAVVKECVATSMSADTMKKIVEEMISAYKSNIAAGDVSVDLLLAAKDKEEMEAVLKGGLVSKLKDAPVITVSKDFAAGLQIGFKEDEVFLDFSDEALTDLICAYIGPKLTEILQG